MPLHRLVSTTLVLSLGLFTASHAQDTTRRGRKYKAPPDTSHIEVEVLRGYNSKPIVNAAVIFHSVKDGKDEGNMEVKTNEDGKAIIDIIPTGSAVDVQVIADGFATYADNYQVNEATRAIQVKMLRPRAQISTYTDNSGKASTTPVGVQEPAHPHSPPVIQAPQPTNHTSDPNPLAPVDPNATPGNTQNPTPKPQ
jgi:hypothetical protein